MKRIVEMVIPVEIDIPDKEVPNLLKGFQDTIDDTATTDNMLEHIAYNVGYNRAERFVEGVGEISLNNDKPIYSTDGLEVPVKVKLEREDITLEVLGE